MLKSSSCDYSDTYIIVKGTIAITRAEGAGNSAARKAAKESHEENKEIIVKSYVQFADCIREISNSQVDNAKYLDLANQCLI